MKGGIYSSEKCPICGGSFKDNSRTALICPDHPGQRATHFIVKFEDVWKRFKSYDMASRLLNGLRFKTDEGTFDNRDYKKDNPLGFQTQIESWLKKKQEKVVPKNFKNIENYASKAISYYGQKNIKEIDYAELEDFMTSLTGLSSKTKSNIINALYNFWGWMVKRKVINRQQFPDFPDRYDYELGYRRIVSREQQAAILEEIKRLTYHINPKIWIGCKFLSTYISIRPGELVDLQEGNIDKDEGWLVFPFPKEDKYKSVPITNEDREILKTFPPATKPDMPFFRHTKYHGQKEGTPFGQKVFYRWWKEACKNLGINDVDLYGGTKHSTARHLGKTFSPEQVKRAAMISTNKAFERYFSVEPNAIRSIYEQAQGATGMQPENKPLENGKVLIFKE